MPAWREPSERHSEDLIASIDRAAHSLNHTLKEGFKLVAAAIDAKQGNSGNNAAVIEAAAQQLKILTAQLNKSHP